MIARSIIGSQEHNWLTGSIIGAGSLGMLYNYDTCVMELIYIGCVERTGVLGGGAVVVLRWLMGALG